jgi:hypothetical protein
MVAAAVCAPATQPYAILIGRIAAGLPLPSESTVGPKTSQDPGSPPLTPALGGALTESAVSLFFAGVQYQDQVQREWLITRLLEIERRTGWASAETIARSCETAWEKAGEAGRGPLYQRRTRRFGENEGAENERPQNVARTPGVSNNGNKAVSRDDENRTGGFEGLNERAREEWVGGPPSQPNGSKDPGHYALSQAGNWDESERRYVVRHPAGFVPWAMNLLADEEDLRVRMESVELDEGATWSPYGGT